MVEEPLSDAERIMLLRAAYKCVPRGPGEETTAWADLIGKLGGTDTVLVARRAYSSAAYRRATNNPYVDNSFAERECDYCHTPYRGPAVYCSRICALADA